jgi:putative ABC transporter
LRRATDEVIDVELVEPLRTETQGWAELTRVLERITSG